MRAIMPQLSLQGMLQNWKEISATLSESPRKRKSQEQIFQKTS
jgi:hypothetical protein